MEVIHSVTGMQKRAAGWQSGSTMVGFVPTMGYLHEGHLSLLDIARKHSDLLVMSIFVNPTQFGEGEDYARYPRDPDRDAALASERGVDLIFSPPVAEMYPEGYSTYVEVERLSDRLCGASRPGHFRGVTTVVTKLFNIIRPDLAVFGQKDAQQAIILRRLVRDLNLDIEILLGPIVRETDGLAMSSRNTYLSPSQREQALCLSQGLQAAKKMVETGERDSNIIVEKIRSLISEQPEVDEDYVAVVDPENLQSLDQIDGMALIAVAAYVGTTRLIDNIIVNNNGSHSLKIEDTSGDYHRS